MLNIHVNPKCYTIRNVLRLPSYFKQLLLSCTNRSHNLFMIYRYSSTRQDMFIFYTITNNSCQFFLDILAQQLFNFRSYTRKVKPFGPVLSPQSLSFCNRRVTCTRTLICIDCCYFSQTNEVRFDTHPISRF